MTRIVLSVFCGFMILFVQTAYAMPAIQKDSPIEASSAIIYDMKDDVILFEQNADLPVAPASLTKIMSMFLAWDYIARGKISLDALVPVSKDAASQSGSRMGIRAGETVPLHRLLLGMAVSSGNDASYAVAEFIGGNAENFVGLMNLKAKSLGMTETEFFNPHGLPAKGQITTARNMLFLARAYIKAYPHSLAYHNTRTLAHGRVRTWNKNPLLGQYEGADGLKTGWVKASGHNLIFTARQNGRRLVGVILGAADAAARGNEAGRLLDAAFMAVNSKAATVYAALDQIPQDMMRIDALKTGREAGLIKRKYKRASAANIYGKKRYSRHKSQTAAKRQGEGSKKKAAAQGRRKTHAQARSRQIPHS